MGNFVLNLHDLLNLYNGSKRKERKYPAFAYDIDKESFISVTDNVIEKIEQGKISAIPFINSYKTCLEIIDDYLAQPSMEKYRKGAYKAMRDKNHDKVVAFLWYFEHIDGTYSFENYENKKVFRIITKWAIKNGFEYEFKPNGFVWFGINDQPVNMNTNQ